MAEQDLKLRVSVDGAKQAAQDLQSVAAAQGQVGAAASASATSATPKLAELGESAKKAADESRQLQEEFRNFVNALPGGERVSRVIRLMNALGDGTVSVGDAFAKAKVLLEGFGGGLKLLGAAGAVIAGLQLIAASVKAVGEEFEKATKAIEDQREALNELARAKQEQSGTIADVAFQRREGGFTADQERAASDTADRLRQRAPFLDDDAINRTLGIFGGADDAPSGGGTRSIDELERIARLQQGGKLELDPKASRSTIESRTNRALAKHKEALDRDFQRGRDNARASAQAAQVEAASGGAPNNNIEDFVRKNVTPGTSDEDIAEIIKFFPAERRPRQNVNVGKGFRETLPFISSVIEGGVPGEDFPRNEIGQQIDSLKRQLNATAGQSNVTNNTTIIGQQRQYNNGRQAQKEATSNGETRFANK